MRDSALGVLFVFACLFGKGLSEGFNSENLNIKEEDNFKFASYYGNHMVLQKGPKQATVWGYASMNNVGSSVNITVSNDNYKKSYQAAVRKGNFADKAVWSVLLEARTDPSPLKIVATLDTQTISLEDVLYGDVWLCSGQSNMQFTMSMVYNATKELAEASKYSQVRIFTAAEVESSTPLYDLQTVEEQWSLPSEKTVGGKAWSYFSAVCWLYGRNIYKELGYPIGLVATDWGGTPVEAWSSPDALSKCPSSKHAPKSVDHRLLQHGLVGGPGDHSVLWNAMIHPFLNMTIYGAIWYQGEANAHSPSHYACNFQQMIFDWRQKFYDGTSQQTDKLFPFGFVQLAGFENKTVIKGFTDIRWHQTYDMGYVPNPQLPNVFMAVAMDLPDFKSPYGSIHPRDKQTVAERLALSGMSVAYGKQGVKFQGPTPSAYFVDIGYYTLGIEFDQRKHNIFVNSADGFEVCCQKSNTTYCDIDGTDWIPAPIIKSDKNMVTLDWKKCTGKWLMGYRYAWRETPCDYKSCAVYSMENNLPMAPMVELGIFGEHMYKGN